MVSLLVSLLSSLTAQAEGKPPSVQIEGGAGQLSLGVVREDEAFAVSVCAHAPCAAAQMRVPFPKRFSSTSPELRVTQLDRGRKVLVAVQRDAEQGDVWVTVLAAPLSSGDGKARVVFNDLADGDADPRARASHGVQVFADGSTSQLVIGSRREDLGLCGRPALLSPKVLDPVDLTLKPAKVQRLARSERQAAKRVVAVRRSADKKPPLGRLLSAVGASSAVGSPQALTDGDRETAWAEARGGEGRGEFATMRSSADVAMTQLSFTIRPPTQGAADGVSPKSFFVAFDEGLIEVVLPEDAWKFPGASYDVTLPSPVASACVAVVLDDAFVGKDAKRAQVTIAEIEARSALDEQTDLPGLVLMLNEGGERARAAQAVLMRAGEPALAAVQESYGVLGDSARKQALDVADQSPCEQSASLYVTALGSKFEAEHIHARTRIERCRKGAVPALITAVRDPQHPAHARAAEELSVISPADAVAVIAPSLADGKLSKSLRVALVRAARSPRAIPALASLFADAALPVRATLALLRAADERIADEGLRASASQALARVASPSAPFEERYLALEPAAHLAAHGEPQAKALLEAALRDQDLHLRATAARFIGPVPALRPALAPLAADAEPRVRQAAALALAAPSTLLDAKAPLLSLLGDEWTFVRQAAYDGLAQAGADASIDEALKKQLEKDKSPPALARAIEAVAKRRVVSAGPALLALATNERRALDVRARAIRALGSVCYRDATSKLTDLARAGVDGQATPDTEALSSAAVVALGRLHPSDLSSRLAPLRGEGAPRVARMAAQAAIDETDVCR